MQQGTIARLREAILKVLLKADFRSWKEDAKIVARWRLGPPNDPVMIHIILQERAQKLIDSVAATRADFENLL